LWIIKKQEPFFNDSRLSGCSHHTPPKPVSPIYYSKDKMQTFFRGFGNKIVNFIRQKMQNIVNMQTGETGEDRKRQTRRIGGYIL
jgi:hypothetical protein